MGRIIGATPQGTSETATVLGDAYISATGSLEPVDSTMSILSLQLWISDTSRFNIGYGLNSVDVPSATDLPAAGALAIAEDITTIHANFFWDVSRPVQYGVEYLVKEVTANQGITVDSAGNPSFTNVVGRSSDSGEAARLQFSARYDF